MRALCILAVVATPARAETIPYEDISEPKRFEGDALFETRSEWFATSTFVVARDTVAEVETLPFLAVGLRAYGVPFASASFAIVSDTQRGGCLGGIELHKQIGKRTFFDAGIGIGGYFVGARAVVTRATLGFSYFVGEKLALRLVPEGVFAIGSVERADRRADFSSLGGGLGIGIGYKL